MEGGGSRFVLSVGAGAAGKPRSVAEEAREAREARERARRHQASVARLQRACRRFLLRQRIVRLVAADVDKKLRDLETLRQVVAASPAAAAASSLGGFCPPLAPTTTLVRRFVLVHDREAKRGRRRRCRLEQEETRMVEEAEAVRVARLCACALLPHLQEEAKARDLRAALQRGGGEGDLLTPLVEALLEHAGSIDYASTTNEQEDPRLVVLRTLPGLCAGTDALVARVWLAVRGVCLRYDAAFFGPSKRGPSASWLASKPFRELFSLVQALLLSGATGTNAVLTTYTAQLLTLPTVAAHVEHGPPVLPRLLAACQQHAASPADALPPSPNPAAPSLVWLLSNLSCTLHSALVASSTDAAAVAAARALLLDEGDGGQTGLATVSSLLSQAPPGCVSDVGMVSLLRKGASITTLAVDPQIVQTLQLVFREAFLRRLVATTLLRPAGGGGNHDGGDEQEEATLLQAWERAEDTADVAFNANSLDLTFACHEQRRLVEEASWFSKAARRVGSLFGGWGGGDKAKGDGKGPRQREREAAEAGEGDGLITAPPPPPPAVASAAAEMRATSGTEAIVEFLAVALWKCFSVESQSPSHAGSLGVPVRNGLLNTLAFSHGGAAARRLWLHLLARYPTELERSDRLALASYATPADCHDPRRRGLAMSLAVLAAVLQQRLLVLTDDELISSSSGLLPLPHLLRLVKLLKALCFQGCQTFASHLEQQQAAPASGAVADVPFGRFVFHTLSRLLRRLFDRWSRRAFCRAEVWSLGESQADRAQRALEAQAAFGKLLLQTMPFALPFQQRLGLLRRWIEAEKRAFQRPDSRPTLVKIRRGYVLEDGLAMLSKLPASSIKGRLVIVFVSEAGHQESGIDSGGLLREFVYDMVARSFAPDFGLFARTEEGCLYPSPSSALAHEQHLVIFELLGRTLAKAVCESIVVPVFFAPFFLGYLKGSYNYMNQLDDLRQVDAEVHKHLSYLRSAQDVAALGLTFSVAREAFGQREEVDLLPNGRNLPVTEATRTQYVHAVAKHYLVDRIAAQTQAFLRGFHAVVPAHVLGAFSEPELQILLAGSVSGAIDVQDMRAHAQYLGGYTSIDRSVRRLWSVLEGLGQAELTQFLAFVTSSRRPPAGGFRNLHPPLTIVRVPIRSDAEKLPVGRTCFNQLLWPTYSSAAVAREKLLFAIQSGAGFELT